MGNLWPAYILISLYIFLNKILGYNVLIDLKIKLALILVHYIGELGVFAKLKPFMYWTANHWLNNISFPISAHCPLYRCQLQNNLIPEDKNSPSCKCLRGNSGIGSQKWGGVNTWFSLCQHIDFLVLTLSLGLIINLPCT